MEIHKDKQEQSVFTRILHFWYYKHQIPYESGVMWWLSFCSWFISLPIMPSSSIHASTNDKLLIVPGLSCISSECYRQLGIYL